MNRLQLPVGDSSFRNLRTSDCYYADKTAHLQQRTRAGRYWFLSRPRRFGKTLPVDTLHELFASSEDLFRGLDIHPQWDWQTTCPVVRLSFDAEYHQSDTLHSRIPNQLAALRATRV